LERQKNFGSAGGTKFVEKELWRKLPVCKSLAYTLVTLRLLEDAPIIETIAPSAYTDCHWIQLGDSAG
jgi:hypothetical protein